MRGRPARCHRAGRSRSFGMSFGCLRFRNHPLPPGTSRLTVALYVRNSESIRPASPS